MKTVRPLAGLQTLRVIIERDKKYAGIAAQNKNVQKNKKISCGNLRRPQRGPPAGRTKINFRQMIEGWLLHIIFSHLPPRDLISCAAVCREFYAIARADKAWERHKQRVLEYCPTLQPVFDQHGQETDGKRVLKKRKKQTPQGTWYIFARFLMRCPFQLAFERRRSNFAVVITSDVLNAAILCLYGRDAFISASIWRKYAVDNSQKIDFIRIWIKTENQQCVHFHGKWLAKTVDVYQGGLWYERKIETGIISAPFLALVHDDAFETFSKKQIEFNLA